MTSAEEKAYNWVFGLHSRIPACCIEFFIEEWDAYAIYNQQDNPYRKAVDAARFGYVPCPRCLGTNNRAKLKVCAIECGGNHRDDFKPGGRAYVD